MPRVGLLGHVVGLVFNFLKNLHTVFHMSVPICIPTNSAQGFPLLCMPPTTCYSCHFGSRHPNRCDVISPCGFVVHFPDDY